jgi:hypothetical protein
MWCFCGFSIEYPVHNVLRDKAPRVVGDPIDQDRHRQKGPLTISNAKPNVAGSEIA